MLKQFQSIYYNAVQLISDAHLSRISILFLLSLSFFINVSLILRQSSFFSFTDDFFHSTKFSYLPRNFFICHGFLIPWSFFYSPKFWLFILFKSNYCNNFLLIGLFLFRCIRHCSIQTLPDWSVYTVYNIHPVIVCNTQISENN